VNLSFKIANLLDSLLRVNYKEKGNLIERLWRNAEKEMLDSTTAKGAPTKSGKREKFVKLAENRTRNAIKAVRVIGKLGNKNAYQFDESDVQKIVRALTKEVEALRARMSSPGSKEAVDFKL
jgi:hypothetical protein